MSLMFEVKWFEIGYPEHPTFKYFCIEGLDSSLWRSTCPVSQAYEEQYAEAPYEGYESYYSQPASQP